MVVALVPGLRAREFAGRARTFGTVARSREQRVTAFLATALLGEQDHGVRL